MLLRYFSPLWTSALRLLEKLHKILFLGTLEYENLLLSCSLMNSEKSEACVYQFLFQIYL